MIKPKRLKLGDTIGVVSPASPSTNRSEIPRAKEYLEALGYNVVIGEHVNDSRGFTAASEEDRAADINTMFADSDIDAIFVTQGGYGSGQIIRLLDYDNIRRHPKIFTGFSDITSLHLAIRRYSDVLTFHSPGMSRFNTEELSDYTSEYFFKALTSTDPIGDIPLANPKKWLYRIAGGVAEGEIIGGNLSLICSAMGTPYEPDFEDKIMFFEEVDTEPWIADGYLSQLRNAGKFDGLRGILIAECRNCTPCSLMPGFFCDFSFEDVMEYYLSELGIPVLYGLPLGHTVNMATLPLGVKCRLDADNKTFTVLESGVV